MGMREQRLFTIGEFSRITGLTVKTLRFYHDEGLLPPTVVDQQSGYRYYDASLVERAKAIAYLRSLEFSVAETRDVLKSAADDADLIEVMEKQRAALREKIERYRHAAKSLDEFIAQQKGARVAMSDSTFNVEEKTLPAMLVAGIRMKGKYSDCGKGFGKLGRSFGRHIKGKPLMLHYDTEYKEDDADFEACMPVRQGKNVEGVSVRELPGGRCVSLVHKGPYDQLGTSYEKVLKYVKEKGYRVGVPSREVYVKGPGMIFKGNPKDYLTEIQMMIE